MPIRPALDRRHARTPSALIVCGAAIALAGCSSDEDPAQTSASSSGNGAASSSSSSASSSGSGAGGGSSTGGGSASGGSAGAGGDASGGSAGAGGSGGGGGDGGGGTFTVAGCYIDDFVSPPLDGPNYDQFTPVVGSHCMGTNHQDITGVERVVFVGDSVTVGTPPTLSADYYRSKLAASLAAKFGLTAPSFLWQTVNFLDGVSLIQEEGDFASCAKWGARTDDLVADNTQLETCIPLAQQSKRTLVVMTMGGNDISSLTQDAIAGVPMADLWTSTQGFVADFEAAIAWIKEPGRFPNGVYVVYGNMYEFTDGTGDVQSCDVSALAGFDQPVPAPDELKAMVIWANEQYARISVDWGVDMTFMLEDFCGHGFASDDPTAPCYRGPNTPQWFDLTCIHPNPAGHQHISDMFMAVVNE
jgi:lysophospholipase L1-like esterase